MTATLNDALLNKDQLGKFAHDAIQTKMGMRVTCYISVACTAAPGHR
jgi:hypothetical protein